MTKQWKLGADLHEQDNLLDGFTFEDVITALHCGEKTINPAAVHRVVHDMLAGRLQDLYTLIYNNTDAIINRATKGRD